MTVEAYRDNVLVYQNEGSGEFLAIRFDPEADTPVCLYRYMLPGRIDVYSFDWQPGREAGVGDHLRYFSDGSMSLFQALGMVEADLDKEAVVEMLIKACRNRGTYLLARMLVNSLLALLAPKSKAAQACRKCMNEILQAQRKRIAQLRKEREAVKP